MFFKMTLDVPSSLDSVINGIIHEATLMQGINKQINKQKNKYRETDSYNGPKISPNHSCSHAR